MYYNTIYTAYGDRVEALKNSIQNNPGAWKEGVTIAYIISNSSGDRGTAIVTKKTEKNRCCFHYMDYWGVNQFWTLTDAGWEKK